jgi:hypothetical protein
MLVLETDDKGKICQPAFANWGLGWFDIQDRPVATLAAGLSWIA